MGVVPRINIMGEWSRMTVVELLQIHTGNGHGNVADLFTLDSMVTMH